MFINHEQVNTYSIYYWAVKNSHSLRQVDYQRSWNNVNAWCKIVRRKIIEPFFFIELIIVKRASHLENSISKLLDDVSYDNRTGMWYHSCSAHFAPRISQIDRIFPKH
jgi:hypothetical protein